MPPASSSRGTRRKMADNDLVEEPPSKSPKVTLLGPSLLVLEVPADTNTSFPVWEAMLSRQLDVAWTVNPYSISVHLTPVTSKRDKTTTESESESTAQTPVPSCSFLPQVVIQSFTQQHSTPQNNSCVLVSLPFIITHPQPTTLPSTPTKEVVPPAIKTPTATPTKVQAPSKVPVPSPFHTKNSSDVQICDNFLLSLCHAGRNCKMHHTPYPFHWQLWCVITHQWINVNPRSQVLLERLYCNVNKEGVCIKDGNAHYYLNFDSLELEDESKYDRVRRLTNSDRASRNPYFPSKWRIYWWNDFRWEEYNKNVSTLLLKNMSTKEPECSVHIGSKEYRVDFTTMTQTNVKTGFNREIRCRPFYYSPEFMQPHLRTTIENNSSESSNDPPPPNFSVDPLEEFSSWYPPVWCQASEQDYSLVDVPAGTQTYKSIQNLFFESMSDTEVDIISIQQVQNLLHWDKYQRHKAHMQKNYTNSKDPLERHVFHGTSKTASEDICLNNFDPRVAGVNGTSLGHGSYFATSASFSNRYSAIAGSDKVRHMFLAKVLVGKMSLGKSNYRRPPPVNAKTKQYRLYDTCVDSLKKPTMFVVFDSCQCYPYYLIKYQDLPKEIEI